jgi:predicted nucleotidyltransferase component of viral defense system
MLVDELKSIVRENKKNRSVFLRNLLKEQLQYYVLDYIYSSEWGNRFLFKGGTCLRFCFDLPRLSEDLDFDIQDYDSFDLEKFRQSLENYFTKHLQVKRFNLKTAGNNQQIFLKFPLMEELGLRNNAAQTDTLFLRLDIQGIDSDIYEEKVSLISEANFNFIVKRYSLADLFSSKIAAILTRSFKKGKNNRITFKGRDYFDLIWFLEKGVKPNFKRLKDITGYNKKAVSEKLNNKVQAINIKYLKEDLLPLFPSEKFVTGFCNNFEKLYKNHRCPKCGSILAKSVGAFGVGAGSETNLPQLTTNTYQCLVCKKTFSGSS